MLVVFVSGHDTHAELVVQNMFEVYFAIRNTHFYTQINLIFFCFELVKLRSSHPRVNKLLLSLFIKENIFVIVQILFVVQALVQC